MTTSIDNIIGPAYERICAADPGFRLLWCGLEIWFRDDGWNIVEREPFTMDGRGAPGEASINAMVLEAVRVWCDDREKERLLAERVDLLLGGVAP